MFEQNCAFTIHDRPNLKQYNAEEINNEKLSWKLLMGMIKSNPLFMTPQYDNISNCSCNFFYRCLYATFLCHDFIYTKLMIAVMMTR